MHREYGSRPSDMLCCIGPCIGKECYEVSRDVAEAFSGDIILVAPAESDFEGDIEKIYKEKWEVGHFSLYYNP